MFLAIKVKDHFADEYSEECIIDTSSVKMLLKIYDFYVIDTTIGRFQIDKQSYDDLRRVLYGKEVS